MSIPKEEDPEEWDSYSSEKDDFTILTIPRRIPVEIMVIMDDTALRLTPDMLPLDRHIIRIDLEEDGIWRKKHLTTDVELISTEKYTVEDCRPSYDADWKFIFKDGKTVNLKEENSFG